MKQYPTVGGKPNMTIRLSEFRESAGLSQIQLAEALGTSQQNISFYEQGRHTPSPQRLVEIAKILGVSVDELLAEPTTTPQNVSRETL